MPSEILIQNREIMKRQWVSGSQQMRRSIKGVVSNLQEQLDSINVEDNKHLQSVDVQVLMTLAATQLEQVSKDALKVLTAKIDISIRNSITAYNKVLELNGVLPLDEAEISEIIRRARINSMKEFPAGSGVSYLDRIQAAEIRHTNQLQKVLSQRFVEQVSINKIKSDVFRALQKTGSTAIRGGSLANNYTAILTAEVSRISTEVGLDVMQTRGLQYAYWSLNPAHPDYGGAEICDIHANSIFSGSIDELQQAGLGHVSLTGLYEVSNYPPYPHPWCGCFPEPVF